MPPLALPFAHLNLRRNPFGEATAEERAELAIVDVGPYLQAIRAPRFAIQFLGEAGRGKSTHLLAIRFRSPAAGFVYIPERGRVRIPRGSPLIIDEVQRLSRVRRWWQFRRGVPLVLGTHCDLEPELRNAGYQVETVEVALQMDRERLLQVLNRRIQWCRRDPRTPIPKILPETANRLLKQYRSNVRAIEGHLYQVFQRMTEISDV